MLESYLGQKNEADDIIVSAPQNLMLLLSHTAPLDKARNKPLITARSPAQQDIVVDSGLRMGG